MTQNKFDEIYDFYKNNKIFYKIVRFDPTVFHCILDERRQDLCFCYSILVSNAPFYLQKLERNIGYKYITKEEYFESLSDEGKKLFLFNLDIFS